MATEYPIIALWSHPRSMSTAMERIMRERGDLICAHEPFMYDYYVHRQVRVMPNFDIEKDRPQSYQEIRKWLLEQAEIGPVFFKDMSYYVIPQILEDEEFLQRVTHTFLIRNPVASILSYYKLDPEVTLEEIGLEAQWKHFSALKRRGIEPVVLEADLIRADTQSVISEYWRKIGLSQVEEAFDWQDEKPNDWKQVSGWHGDVMQSKGIKAAEFDEAEKKRREFDEQCQSAPHVEKYLEHHFPFYEKLKASV
ncbi:MAG: hypothetical protein AAF478_03390 [Pseudomonadota bacterium]